MLKICSENIAAPLQIILNKSLLQGKYPTSWKIAHLIAIYRMPLYISNSWSTVEYFGRKPD
jgi:hypothetical protein